MDSETEARLLANAERVSIDLELLGYAPDERAPGARGESLRSAQLLAGSLWDAAQLLIDELVLDVVAVHSGDGPDDWLEAVRESNVLDGLPERFHHRISPGVATRFLLVASDLTARVSSGWRPPACVAQELMLRELLGRVEVIADTYDVPLPEDWREELESQLFEDLDHEYLFDPGLDGFEDDPTGRAAGVTRMDFGSWFAPFGPEYRLTPYLESFGGPGA